MERTITFNTADNRLIVAYEDGTTHEYNELSKNQYLLDYPDRLTDLVAMGWVTL